MFDPKKLMDAMKQAMDMQQQMQQEMKAKTVHGAALGDMVVVSMNGQFEVGKIIIDPKLVKDNDLEFVQEMIRAAVNDAVSKAKEVAADQMKSITGKLGL